MKTNYKHETDKLKAWSITTALACSIGLYFAMPTLFDKFTELISNQRNDTRIETIAKTQDLNTQFYSNKSLEEYGKR